MSEELKDDEVIGMSGYIDADIPVEARDLDEQNREYCRIGKAACQTDPSIIGIMAGKLWLAIAKHSKASCPIELIKGLWKAYDAGLAAGQKAEHDAMLLNVPKVRRKLNVGNTGEPL